MSIFKHTVVIIFPLIEFLVVAMIYTPGKHSHPDFKTQSVQLICRCLRAWAGLCRCSRSGYPTKGHHSVRSSAFPLEWRFIPLLPTYLCVKACLAIGRLLSVPGAKDIMTFRIRFASYAPCSPLGSLGGKACKQYYSAFF